jgi:very-short-patch-repair endonuclease
VEADPELAVAYGLFSVAQARAAGHRDAEIRRLVSRGTWRRLSRGILTVEGRAEAAGGHLLIAVLQAGPGAVLGFESAAAVHGWDAADPSAPARVIVPLNSSHRPGPRRALGPDEIMVRGVLPLTTPVRTAVDLACDLAFEAAVVSLDSALRARQFTPDELNAAFATSRGSGIRAGRVALAAADANSGSVPETEARLLFGRAQLLKPRTQQPVRLGDRVVFLDFGWEEFLLGVELDGFAYHSAVGDFQRDRRRQNAVQLGGWLILRFTVHDIRYEPDRVIEEIWAGLNRPLVGKRQSLALGPRQTRTKGTLRSHFG